MPYAQAGEVRLYYESFGRGVPFLLVSGTGWPGEPWKLKQVPAFIDRYQVIVYDHRGVGKSDAPSGYYSTRQFAQDAANLLDALGINEPVHIIGHSMGGRVCQWLALDYPRKLRSMIQAASGSGSMGNPEYPRWLTVDSLKSMIEKGYKEHMLSHFKSRFFFPPEFVKSHPEVLETLFKSFWDNRPQLDPYLRHVIARNQHETGELLDKINTPTLVLVGDDDKADADTSNHIITSEHLHDNIRNAEFAVVEGGGNGLFWPKPEETNKIVRDWLDRH